MISLTYFAAFIVLGMTAASLGPTLTGLAGQILVSLDEISILFSVRALGYLAGVFFGGRTYDRWAGHPLMAAALFMMALPLGLVPSMSTLAGLGVLLFIVGIGEGLLDVGGNTLLVWRLGDRAGPSINALHFFFGLGAVLAPMLVGWVLIQGVRPAWVYWIMAGLILPWGLILLTQPSPRAQAEAPEAAETRVNLRILLPVVFTFSMIVAAEVGFSGWIFAYMTETGLGSEANAAFLTSAFWLAFMMGRLIAMPFSDKKFARRVLSLGVIGGMLSLIAMLLWANSLIALWSGTIVFGLALAPLFAALFTHASRLHRASGRLTSYYFLGGILGSSSVPWIIGQLFERPGPQILLWLTLLVLSLGGILLIIIFRASSRQQSLNT
jgi:FHS family Na+ dependent glucose MFS transporter 1